MRRARPDSSALQAFLEALDRLDVDWDCGPAGDLHLVTAGGDCACVADLAAAHLDDDGLVQAFAGVCEAMGLPADRALQAIEGVLDGKRLEKWLP